MVEGVLKRFAEDKIWPVKKKIKKINFSFLSFSICNLHLTPKNDSNKKYGSNMYNFCRENNYKTSVANSVLKHIYK